MNLRMLATLGLVAVALGCSPNPAPTHRPPVTVDWGSIHTFVGTYHILTVYAIDAPYHREESNGRSTISYKAASRLGVKGAREYLFEGNSEVTASTWGPTATGRCAFQAPSPNHVAHSTKIHIVLGINTKSHTYWWNANPILIHFLEGGYSPDCGGFPKKMTVDDIGGGAIGMIPLPSVGNVLCGTAKFTDPGDFTSTMDWRFFPSGSAPPTFSPCPAVRNPNAGAGNGI